ncbi:hypothetical protein LEP1GSC188_4008 [Leptospira weilii serovar Topaz str. LT2116]|uniref:Uncharacterized protein n=1 Tax=Leptospira weilii serovar Topaz str. LT2116 TaxID=1088540 RepID=M3GE99_9LEPT|nr:hypothetical protein LEP1GSC188_4008 [Leptospira weilii serovar Topaz str. LT2116]
MNGILFYRVSENLSKDTFLLKKFKIYFILVILYLQKHHYY